MSDPYALLYKDAFQRYHGFTSHPTPDATNYAVIWKNNYTPYAEFNSSAWTWSNSQERITTALGDQPTNLWTIVNGNWHYASGETGLFCDENGSIQFELPTTNGAYVIDFGGIAYYDGQLFVNDVFVSGVGSDILPTQHSVGGIICVNGGGQKPFLIHGCSLKDVYGFRVDPIPIRNLIGYPITPLDTLPSLNFDFITPSSDLCHLTHVICERSHLTYHEQFRYNSNYGIYATLPFKEQCKTIQVEYRSTQNYQMAYSGYPLWLGNCLKNRCYAGVNPWGDVAVHLSGYYMINNNIYSIYEHYSASGTDIYWIGLNSAGIIYGSYETLPTGDITGLGLIILDAADDFTRWESNGLAGSQSCLQLYNGYFTGTHLLTLASVDGTYMSLGEYQGDKVERGWCFCDDYAQPIFRPLVATELSNLALTPMFSIAFRHGGAWEGLYGDVDEYWGESVYCDSSLICCDINDIWKPANITIPTDRHSVTIDPFVCIDLAYNLYASFPEGVTIDFVDNTISCSGFKINTTNIYQECVLDYRCGSRSFTSKLFDCVGTQISNYYASCNGFSNNHSAGSTTFAAMLPTHGNYSVSRLEFIDDNTILCSGCIYTFNHIPKYHDATILDITHIGCGYYHLYFDANNILHYTPAPKTAFVNDAFNSPRYHESDYNYFSPYYFTRYHISVDNIESNDWVETPKYVCEYTPESGLCGCVVGTLLIKDDYVAHTGALINGRYSSLKCKLRPLSMAPSYYADENTTPWLLASGTFNNVIYEGANTPYLYENNTFSLSGNFVYGVKTWLGYVSYLYASCSSQYCECNPTITYTESLEERNGRTSYIYATYENKFQYQFDILPSAYIDQAYTYMSGLIIPIAQLTHHMSGADIIDLRYLTPTGCRHGVNIDRNTTPLFYNSIYPTLEQHIVTKDNNTAGANLDLHIRNSGSFIEIQYGPSPISTIMEYWVNNTRHVLYQNQKYYLSIPSEDVHFDQIYKLYFEDTPSGLLQYTLGNYPETALEVAEFQWLRCRELTKVFSSSPVTYASATSPYVDAMANFRVDTNDDLHGICHLDGLTMVKDGNICKITLVD